MPGTVRKGAGADPANYDLSTKLNEWLQTAGPSGVFRTCASCRKMANPPNAAHCALFGATPPVDVILNGCDKHDDECEPPF